MSKRRNEWQNLADEMADFEEEMLAFSNRMGEPMRAADESVAYTKETYRSGGKTTHRENHRPVASPASLSERDRNNLQEWMESRMEHVVQQHMNTLYLLIGMSMLLSLLALIVALFCL